MGERRNAELSRAAVVAMAGGALISISQSGPQLASSPVGAVVLVAGGAAVIVALVLAVRSFIGRSGGPDQ